MLLDHAIQDISEHLKNISNIWLMLLKAVIISVLEIIERSYKVSVIPDWCRQSRACRNGTLARLQAMRQSAELWLEVGGRPWMLRDRTADWRRADGGPASPTDKDKTDTKDVPNIVFIFGIKYYYKSMKSYQMKYWVGTRKEFLAIMFIIQSNIRFIR